MPLVRRQDEPRRVDLAEAKKLFDTGAALFVDVRKPEAYEQSHIPGAISIPIKEILRRVGELPRGRTIVLYCA